MLRKSRTFHECRLLYVALIRVKDEFYLTYPQFTSIGITGFYGYKVAAKYHIASGLPDTRRTSFRPLPNAQIFIQGIVNNEDINALRLPTFASLDIRAEKRLGFKLFSFALYIDYFNITNHDSVVQPNYEFYRRTPQFLSENQRFPIFGLRLEF